VTFNDNDKDKDKNKDKNPFRPGSKTLADLSSKKVSRSTPEKILIILFKLVLVGLGLIALFFIALFITCG